MILLIFLLAFTCFEIQSNDVLATPITIPGAPQYLIATPGYGYVSLTWQIPADNGGSAITNYSIYQGTSPGGETLLVMLGNVTTYTSTGLTNGQVHYFLVAATNGKGTGANSTGASATPLQSPTVPSAPQNVVTKWGNGVINIAWMSPNSDGGLAITNYTVYQGTRSGGEVFLVTLDNVLTYNDTGLTNGQAYYFKISAVNLLGRGVMSSEVSSTPETLPAAPQLLLASPGMDISRSRGRHPRATAVRRSRITRSIARHYPAVCFVSLWSAT